MFLCLMRHGKAEILKHGSNDSQRHLTENGRQRVTVMASLAKRWWPAGNTIIWSSPLVRARETAIIMGRAIQAVYMDMHSSIAAGDLRSFYQDVLIKEKNDVVLVVGHEPFLGHWSKEITGTPIDFKTGSIAIFEYDPTAGSLGHGNLFLYVQPKAATLIL